MNARIDIRTPAGQSLEGFPHNFKLDSNITTVGTVIFDSYFSLPENNDIDLHKGDIITIEIL